jgi:hypothetical protein
MKVPNSLPYRFKNPEIFERGQISRRPRWRDQMLVVLMAFALIFATSPGSLAAQQQGQSGGIQPSSNQQDQQQDQSQSSNGQAYTTQTPEQLQQLVAPIALYPDSLVAQILAATTFPAEVVEADRWVQAHPDLKGDDLAKAVDQMTWDPSVKALTGFPSVLGNMDKNISWTSSLGDAYYNQQQDVMDAIQVMRQKAQDSGNLKTTPQQTVQTQGTTIVIQPADPQIVYVPAYNPWVVYGGPIVAWPGWYPYPGIWWGGGGFSWGVGFGIGWYGGFGWGWNSWGFNWQNRVVVYNHNTYISNSHTFYNRNVYYNHGGDRGVTSNPRGSFDNHGHDNHPTDGRPTDTRGNRDDGGRGHENTRAPGDVYNRSDDSRNHPFNGDNHAARGYAPREDTGTRSGAFSGYGRGGEERGYSQRGSGSFGGGGFGGGGRGGGFGGGGGGRGGGRR